MTGRVTLLLAVVALCGCRTPPPAMDPFLRTTVPPPGTTTGDQYYQGSQPAATSTPAATPAPVVPPPSKYGPPGGSFNYQQSSIDRTKAVAPGNSGLRRSSDWLARARSATIPPPSTAEAVRGADLVNNSSGQIKTTGGFASMAALDPSSATGAATASTSPGVAPAVGSTLQLASGTKLRAESSTTSAEAPASANAAKSGVLLASAVEASPDKGVNTAVFRETAATASADSPAKSTDGGTVIRILTPGGSSTQSSEASSDTQRTIEPASAGGNEITNLPLASPAHRAAVRSNWTRSGTGGATAIATASAISSPPAAAVLKETAATSATTTGGAQTYSYAADYSKLQGKLEFSQSSRQWKLRYIPIDGQTDRFGGSVVLPSSPLLEKFKPGDFVEVTGALSSTASSARGFSPVYDLRQIEALR